MKYIVGLLFFVFFQGGHFIFATNYYLANNGDDAASGRSPGKSWKSIDRLNQVNLKPGDTVFFQAGHVFRGSIFLNQSGDETHPIVFTSHGTGEKPVITGAVPLSNPVNKGGTLVFKTDKKVTHLFVNNKLQTIARYPDTGEYLRMDGGGKDFLVDKEIHEIPFDVLHATARMRVRNWSYSYKKIVKVDSDTLHFGSILCENRLSQPGPCPCQAGWGYYLDNKKEFLNQPGEWFYDGDAGLVYWMKLPGINTVHEFEAIQYQTGLSMKKNVSHVHLENLHFTKFHETGVMATGFNHFIDIDNCKFSNIYKVGIYFKQGSSKCTISYNELLDIYGSGMMLFEMDHFLVEGNSLQRIGLVPGYGLSGISGALGVCICNYETRTGQDTIFNNNNIFRHNHVDSTGWVGIRFDGHNNLMENNVIEHSNITCNDGGLVHTWGGLDSMYTHNSIIRGNVFRFSHGNFKDGALNDHNMSNGIYLDNGSHYMLVENNTVTGVKSGIHVNAGSYGNNIHGNTSYGNKVALSFAEWGNGRFWHKNVGNEATRNILFNTYNLKHTLSLLHTYRPTFDPVDLDYNTYASPREKYHIVKTTVHGERKQTNEYTLDAWKEETGEDKHSDYVEVDADTKSKLFINDTKSTKKIKLDDNYTWMNLDKLKISGGIVLKPYESIILLYK